MEEAHAAIQLTNDNFAAEVEQFPGVVLVDFWAVWCPPCRLISPKIEELAEKYKDDKRVKIAKLNTDENPETAQALNIRSLPSFRFWAAGRSDEKADMIIGVSPTAIEDIEKKLQEMLAKLPAAA